MPSAHLCDDCEDNILPEDSKKNAMSKSFSRMTNAVDGLKSKSYLWGCKLTAASPVSSWDMQVVPEDDDDEHEDEDYLEHQLFVKQVVIGRGATDGEKQIIEVETKTYDGKTISLPMACLVPGRLDMASLDLEFSKEVVAKFRLVEGSGPVHIVAQHLIGFPDEMDDSMEFTDDETEATTEVTETEEDSPRKSHRKYGRGKRNSSTASTGEEAEEGHKNGKLPAVSEHKNADGLDDVDDKSSKIAALKKAVKDEQAATKAEGKEITDK